MSAFDPKRTIRSDAISDKAAMSPLLNASTLSSVQTISSERPALAVEIAFYVRELFGHFEAREIDLREAISELEALGLLECAGQTYGLTSSGRDMLLAASDGSVTQKQATMRLSELLTSPPEH
jgi:hypothetical protein